MNGRIRLAFDRSARWVGLKPLGRKIVKAAHRFALMGSGFSYDMSINGEVHLVRQVMNSYKGNMPFVTFDIGAHQGMWTNFVLERRGERDLHYMFEPTPELFESLMIRSSKSKNIIVDQLAFADVDGTIEFLKYADGKSTVNSLIIAHDFYATEIDPGAIVEVQARKGDSYCRENAVSRINLMKIDVEGGEMMVLNGFSEMIANQQIGIIQFEYGYANGDEGTLMRDFYQFWESNGYSVGVLRRDGVAFQPFSYPLNNFDSGPNFVAALPEYVEMLKYFN